MGRIVLQASHRRAHSRLVQSPRERLTGELVAHDHRPRLCPRVINLEQLIELQTIVPIDF